MRKLWFLMLLTLGLSGFAMAGRDSDSTIITEEQVEEYRKYIDSVENAMNYETGKISLHNGSIELNIPAGFKFLNKQQSNFIITDVWGNPPQSDILGMILPVNARLVSDSSYAFVVSFEPMGYVKDKDAYSIDYEEMASSMRKEEVATNARRKQMGYPAIHFVGWAQKPYYDNMKKVLHWAKELKFEEVDENTLNYDVRVLGRRGVLSLNAVGQMNVLPEVQKNIGLILGMASFTAGNRYEDYVSGSDHVAEYTVGGLVAGKILAKAGGFKFLKIIIGVVIAGVVAGWRWITNRRKKKEEELAYEPTPPLDNTPVP